jgi:hypothetical protein
VRERASPGPGSPLLLPSCSKGGVAGVRCESRQNPESVFVSEFYYWPLVPYSVHSLSCGLFPTLNFSPGYQPYSMWSHSDVGSGSEYHPFSLVWVLSPLCRPHIRGCGAKVW